MDAQSLLAGPRGRRLLFAIGHRLDQQVWNLGLIAAWAPDDVAARSAFCEAIATLVPAPARVISNVVERFELASLRESVDRAMYWQAPDDEDALLARPECIEALRTLATAVSAAPGAQWWESPCAAESQRIVAFDNPGRDKQESRWDFSERLANWSIRTIDDEASAPELAVPVTERISGPWWSIPNFTGLAVTTRELTRGGPIGLTLVEDGFGWTDAEATPVSVAPSARVLEIEGPEAWIGLVERFPLEVTRSRRHNWWRATGVDGRWFIPDWLAASTVFDGVHLTVAGYLATAGRALPVAGGHTVLANFNPDETYWLADMVRPNGSKEGWHRDREEEPWEHAANVP
ncbi:hypothetical protein [Lacisediminihabitans changchengi]|uniref:Uncharacterized protein n=1 Tax=Lacisediminihabitans changchengi TaxID=2787634 RepID=A0A934W3R7_9MICO|nr:hypothetical protein [Lacisediminihabitans changchengi]MBK4346755.1 hypothetical protein [Lacisediminihabitans changchengi]MBK4348122.1 hypothetical protein [Lacisediminihabitans changchengi]